MRQPFKPNKQDEEEKDSKQTGATSTNAVITSAATSTSKTADSLQSNLNEPISSPQPITTAAATTKRTVTGTDADLRRLHLSQAKELLIKYGVPDHEIKKLKRWEIIDVVRTMSTQKAKEGNGAVSKFARGSSKFSQSDAHEKFKEECQRLFELQNRNLASEEFISTDDDEELDEDSDVDEMGKNLESMLQNKISDNASSNAIATNSTEKSNPKNDKSSELKNLIMNNTPGDNKMNSKMKSDQPPMDSNLNRVLKITRTYRDESTGEEYTKVEIVKKQLIIDAYVKIRTTRDDEFIRTAFALDEIEKEQLRKERRKIQEQLRKFKRSEAKRDTKNDDNSPNDGTNPIVHKVRKYNKTGANRKPKVPKSAKLVDAGIPANENANAMISSPEVSNMKKLGIKSSLLHYSSGDEESRVQGEESQSNQNDSIVSSLNNTLNNQPVIRKKRKYQKRKKPETAITDPISKVEGTKLIIQKKAIKLALANASNIGDLQKNNPEELDDKMKGQHDQLKNYDSSISIDSASPVKKKYRVSKKQLKLQESGDIASDSNNLMVVNSVDDSDKTGAPKLKITKKQKSSIILHIPKDKLSLSSSSEALGNTLGATKM